MKNFMNPTKKTRTNKQIAQLRKKLGLTQERFANLLGCTVGSVNRWEKGKTKPSPLSVLSMNNILKNL